MSEARRIERSAGAPVPLLVWPLTAAVLIGVAAFVWGAVAGQERILVAKADIPAGQRVSAAQFEERDAWVRGVPDGALEPPVKLDGRVTRRAIASGRPVPADALTAPIAGLGTMLRLKPGKASAVEVKVGDRVLLRFAPTGGDPELEPVTVTAVLLLAPKVDATDLVVSVRPADVDAVLAVAGRADVFVTPP